MASKKPQTSKIPKLSTPPSTPRGQAQQPQNDSLKYKRTNLPLSPRMQAPNVPTFKPKQGSLAKRVLVPPRNHKSKLETRNIPLASPDADENSEITVEVRNPKVECPLESKKGEGDTRDMADMEISDQVFQSNLVGNAKNLADDSISNEEVDNALIGLIMPTSDSDFAKYLHISSISEETLNARVPSETLLENQDEPDTLERASATSLPSRPVVLAEQSTSTSSLSAIRKLPLLQNLPMGIFDTATFSHDDIEQESEIDPSVKSQILEHAQQVFNELAEEAGQMISESCTEPVENALSVEDKRIDTTNVLLEGVCRDDKDKITMDASTLEPSGVKNQLHEEPETILNTEVMAVVDQEMVEQNLSDSQDEPLLIQIQEDKPSISRSRKASMCDLTSDRCCDKNEMEKSVSVRLSNHKMDVQVLYESSSDTNRTTSCITVIPNVDIDNEEGPDHLQTVCVSVTEFENPADQLNQSDQVGESEALPTLEAHKENNKDLSSTTTQENSLPNGTCESKPPLIHANESNVEIEVLQCVTDTENEIDDGGEEEVAQYELEDTNRNWINTSKKAKTIFSMELPLPLKTETGPAESGNGDGRGVHSPSLQTTSKAPTIKLSNATNDVQKNGIESVLKDSRKLSHVSIQKKEHKTATQSFLAKKVNKGDDPIDTVADRIVDKWIKTSSTQLSNNSTNDGGCSKKGSSSGVWSELVKENGCKAYISKRLTLKRENGFCNLIPIHNPTSSLYAFKICCSDSSDSNIVASPDIGLARPGSTAFIKIKASKVPSDGINKRTVLTDKVDIKMFPACSSEDDPEKLNKSYQNFFQQCPSLIHSQPVDLTIAWDGGDENVTQCFDFSRTEKNEEQLKTAKSDRHTNHAETVGSTTETHSEELTLLKAIKEQLIIGNDHLKRTVEEIVYFQRSQWVNMGLMLLLIGTTCIPYFKQEQPSPEELSFYERILAGLYLK